MIELSPLRHLLESLGQGVPWAVLFAGLRLAYALLRSAKAQAWLGPVWRPVAVSLVTALGTMWPQLTSGDTGLSSALTGLIFGLLAAWYPPTNPPGASAPSGGPAPLKSARGAASILLMALALVVLPFVAMLGLNGCAPPRPPGRDACYVEADATALRRYSEECAAYDRVADCPAAPTIERAHQREQEACK